MAVSLAKISGSSSGRAIWVAPAGTRKPKLLSAVITWSRSRRWEGAKVDDRSVEPSPSPTSPLMTTRYSEPSPDWPCRRARRTRDESMPGELMKNSLSSTAGLVALKSLSRMVSVAVAGRSPDPAPERVRLSVSLRSRSSRC